MHEIIKIIKFVKAMKIKIKLKIKRVFQEDGASYTEEIFSLFHVFGALVAQH